MSARPPRKRCLRPGCEETVPDVSTWIGKRPRQREACSDACAEVLRYMRRQWKRDAARRGA